MTQPMPPNQRPSFLDAVVSPTVLWSVAAASLLLVTFFLPHSLQADGQISRPAWTALDLARGQSDRPVFSLAAVWPYAYATSVVVVLLALAWRRPENPARILIAIPLGGSVALFGLWLLLLFGGSDSSRMAMGSAAVVMPLAMCGGARVWWMYRRSNHASAATWWHSLICVLAAFSLRWCWFPEVDRMEWGGWLAIAATLIMMATSWIWSPRAGFDLLERGKPPSRFQFTLWQILLCMTLSAIALTYWQALGSWRQ